MNARVQQPSLSELLGSNQACTAEGSGERVPAVRVGHQATLPFAPAQHNLTDCRAYPHKGPLGFETGSPCLPVHLSTWAWAQGPHTF